MTLVADYSDARPSPAALHGAGFRGVMRYLSHYAPKALSAAELRSLVGAGLAVGVVFEDSASDSLNGRGQGIADAHFANAEADALGLPASQPIYFAVDVDATQTQIAGPILAYFQGAAATSKRPVGVYGEAAVVDGMIRAKAAAYGWQTVAWSGGQHSSLASLYQENVHTVHVPGVPDNAYDENVILHTDWGQYPRPAVGPAPAPAPVPHPAPAPPSRHNPALVRGLQNGWHVTPDGSWGPTTDGRGLAVRSAGHNGVIPGPGGSRELLQNACGTKPDDVWGPLSATALLATIRVTQHALGAVPDARWGPDTDGRFFTARTNNLVA